MSERNSSKDVAVRVSFVGMIANCLLTAFKLASGIVSNSGAMISDAVHSASDVFGGLIVIIGVRLAAKEPDLEHPYGHERFECVASLILAIALFLTGGAIGWEAVRKIATGAYRTFEIKGQLATAAAITSIAVKEAMFWYTRVNARRINSSALGAEAWHHRSDALSSVGALIGILGAKLGFPVLEPLASIVICLFIFKVAFDIFKDAIDRMVDHACDQEMEDSLRRCALGVEGVLGIDLLHTRVFGSRIYVDIEICADGMLPLSKAHAISDEVHNTIEREFPQVKHIMVHVNPKE